MSQYVYDHAVAVFREAANKMGLTEAQTNQIVDEVSMALDTVSAGTPDASIDSGATNSGVIAMLRQVKAPSFNVADLDLREAAVRQSTLQRDQALSVSHFLGQLLVAAVRLVK